MFDQSLIDAFKAHAITRFPEEACGLIVNGATGFKISVSEGSRSFAGFGTCLPRGGEMKPEHFEINRRHSSRKP